MLYTPKQFSNDALCVAHAAPPNFVYFATSCSKSSMPLGMFVGSTLVAITFMGGVYAILPAYEADLFGKCLINIVLIMRVKSAQLDFSTGKLGEISIDRGRSNKGYYVLGMVHTCNTFAGFLSSKRRH